MNTQPFVFNLEIKPEVAVVKSWSIISSTRITVIQEVKKALYFLRYEVRRFSTQEYINYLDPSTSAFANSIRHSSTRWVNHRHQSYKAEFVYREVQVVCIKLEAFRELIIRQSQVAESCNTSNPHLLCSYTSGGRQWTLTASANSCARITGQLSQRFSQGCWDRSHAPILITTSCG